MLGATFPRHLFDVAYATRVVVGHFVLARGAPLACAWCLLAPRLLRVATLSTGCCSARAIGREARGGRHHTPKKGLRVDAN